MSLISTKVIKLDVSEIVTELKRLNHNLEQIFQVNAAPATVEDIDPDDYSSVSYVDEDKELIEQHLARRIAGIDVGL